jgi:hypothetical protein
VVITAANVGAGFLTAAAVCGLTAMAFALLAFRRTRSR